MIGGGGVVGIVQFPEFPGDPHARHLHVHLHPRTCTCPPRSEQAWVGPHLILFNFFIFEFRKSSSPPSPSPLCRALGLFWKAARIGTPHTPHQLSSRHLRSVLLLVRRTSKWGGISVHDRHEPLRAVPGVAHPPQATTTTTTSLSFPLL